MDVASAPICFEVALFVNCRCRHYWVGVQILRALQKESAALCDPSFWVPLVDCPSVF